MEETSVSIVGYSIGIVTVMGGQAIEVWYIDYAWLDHIKSSISPIIFYDNTYNTFN
jgi:hypothetical protein